jgi:hypothetical protein
MTDGACGAVAAAAVAHKASATTDATTRHAARTLLPLVLLFMFAPLRLRFLLRQR